ncbi:MAG: hypothetical protein AAF515_14580 [Pseudomonadota bacterium]
MNAFRVFLVLILLIVGLYTFVVLNDYGLTLFSVFFGDIAAMAWPGQFNLDFFCMLLLSALWTAWRNEFAPAGLGLAVLALLFGAPFLAVYLLILSVRTGGDPRVMLLGASRAAR